MSAEETIAEVAVAYGLTPRDLRWAGSRCTRGVALALREACVRLRQLGLSLPQIGQMLGGRHHTTVLHYIRDETVPQPSDSSPLFPCGDPRTPENTYTRTSGRAHCKKCQVARVKANQAGLPAPPRPKVQAEDAIPRCPICYLAEPHECLHAHEFASGGRRVLGGGEARMPRLRQRHGG